MPTFTLKICSKNIPAKDIDLLWSQPAPATTTNCIFF